MEQPMVFDRIELSIGGIPYNSENGKINYSFMETDTTRIFKNITIDKDSKLIIIRKGK